MRHIATMKLEEELLDGQNVIWAEVTVDEEPTERFAVPPHLAAQLPMAINMLRSQMSKD